MSKQCVDGEEDEIKVETRGTVKVINDKIYIAYKDYDNKVVNTNIIKVENESNLSVTKSGYINSKLILEIGRKHYCPYNVGENVIVFGVFTKFIDVKKGEGCYNVSMGYYLDANSRLISDNELHILAKRVED